jgi:F-type H+-transporting ATPase subunit epsilon
MNTFSLVLQDATHSERFDGVSSFVGEDASGSFGIQANHARLMAVLVLGLARFHIGDAHWQYLALPGAVLYFENNILTLNTRRFLRDDDYLRISTALQQQLVTEEEDLRGVKESLHRMEQEVLRRLWEMSRKEA